jgi:sterol desaturase/sphingolipid hydroxylase (fatty acid hydroxylase superfamily)
MTVAAGLAQGVVGVGLWSLAEYVLHRVDMHGRSARGAAAREHRSHHGHLDVPTLTAGTWVGAAIVAGALAVGGYPAVGAGWMAAYVAYELTHRHMHTVSRRARGGPVREGGPLARYHRWARAHHLHHHVVDARSDYGITSPLWDVVFRTYQRPRADVEARADAYAQRRAAR